ncbi:sodium/calcium exchanger 1-like [Menidia menidia]
MSPAGSPFCASRLLWLSLMASQWPPPAVAVAPNGSSGGRCGGGGGADCVEGVLLPVWLPADPAPAERLARAAVYFLGLAYMFLGVSIIADRFMASIEVITSQERRVSVRGPGGERVTATVRVWNETVSNLTLMALGSSAPEILLSVVEVCGHNFNAGELGPNTIVGSAAFNMFVIIGLCVSVVPDGETRRVKHLRVFFVTASWSIFAYTWLYLILAVISPGVVEIWEGLLTLLFFPLCVALAYAADRRLLFHRYKRYRAGRRRGVVVETEGEPDPPKEGGVELDPRGVLVDGEEKESRREKVVDSQREVEEDSRWKEEDSRRKEKEEDSRRKEQEEEDSRWKEQEEEDSRREEQEEEDSRRDEEDSRREVARLLRDLRQKHPDSDPQQLLQTASYQVLQQTQKSRAFYRCQATRSLTGAGDVLRRHAADQARSAPPSGGPPGSEGGSEGAPPGRVFFHPGSYQCLENCGSVALRVVRRGGDPGAAVAVDYGTEDGTARAGSDYRPRRGTLRFPPGQTEAEIRIDIVDDDIFEEDEHFLVHLSNVRVVPGAADQDLDPNGDPNQYHNQDRIKNPNQYPNGDPNQYHNQDRIKNPNQYPNRDPNQDSNQYPNQDRIKNPNQDSNRNPNQYPNQNPNRDSNRDSNQYPNQNPNQYPNQNPNRDSNQYPNQNPNRDSNQVSNRGPNQDPNRDSNQYHNQSIKNGLDPNQYANKDLDPDLDPDQAPVGLGLPCTATVTIFDDDHAGVFGFEEPRVSVSESVGVMEVRVLRGAGARGAVALPYRTREGSAKGGGEDFEDTHGVLEFQNDEIVQTIRINIVDDEEYEKNKNFFLELEAPQLLEMSERKALLLQEPGDFVKTDRDVYRKVQGRQRPAPDTVISITDGQQQEASTVDKLIRKTNLALVIGTSSWRDQFVEAITVSSGDGDDGACGGGAPPSCFDYVMHFLTVFWKVLFALVPPTDLWSGWACFLVSISAIGLLTAVIGDLASHFGCTVGLKDSVTAVVFVALGTSVPDTFASKVAAVQDQYADASIGNVTGSNAVNVFLGIGVAWSIAAVYHHSQGRQFRVDPGTLAFSVTLFTVFALVSVAVLVYRRRPAIGGELGGPRGPKLLTTALFFSLWLLYIVFSSLEAYCHVQGF